MYPKTIDRRVAALAAAALLLPLLVVMTPAALAQPYSSGSDGSLGALSATALETTVVPLPPDGVLHYTTVNIPEGATVIFQANADNTPVLLLATGDINIAGTLSVAGKNGASIASNADLSALGGLAGPGGSDGGHWGTGGGWAGGGPGGGSGFNDSFGAPGGASLINDGPATVCSNRAGDVAYAKPGWIPYHGGSGGGAAGSYAGGGGGGGVTLASSTQIVISGAVTARGGNCWSDAGAGAGGYIRLASPKISGSGSLNATGGTGCGCDAGGTGAHGYIRLEGFDLQGAIVTTASPAAYVALPTKALPYVSGKRPRLVITKVDDRTPLGQLGGFYPPNLVLPVDTELTVELEAQYIPAGTKANVILNTQGKGRTVVESTAFAGAPDKLTATAIVAIPAGTKLGGIQAYIPSMTLPKE